MNDANTEVYPATALEVLRRCLYKSTFYLLTCYSLQRPVNARMTLACWWKSHWHSCMNAILKIFYFTRMNTSG